MSASEFGDHVHRSPAQRHRAKREQQANRAKRRRSERMREAEIRAAERAARATPSRPPCVCLPSRCLGIPGETEGCTYCLSLSVEAHCPQDVAQ
jgi:hypothetical protein